MAQMKYTITNDSVYVITFMDGTLHKIVESKDMAVKYCKGTKYVWECYTVQKKGNEL